MSLSSSFYHAWMIILNYIVIHNLDDILHNRIVSLIQHVLSLINEKFDSYAYKDKLNDKSFILRNFIDGYIDFRDYDKTNHISKLYEILNCIIKMEKINVILKIIL